jgi:hypothetical protein
MTDELKPSSGCHKILQGVACSGRERSERSERTSVRVCSGFTEPYLQIEYLQEQDRERVAQMLPFADIF